MYKDLDSLRKLYTLCVAPKKKCNQLVHLSTFTLTVVNAEVGKTQMVISELMGTCLYTDLRSYVLATSVLSKPATSHFRKKLTQNCRKSKNHMQVHLVVGCSVSIYQKWSHRQSSFVFRPCTKGKRLDTTHPSGTSSKGPLAKQGLLALLFLPRAAGPLHCHQKICRRPKWPCCVCPPHAGAEAA